MATTHCARRSALRELRRILHTTQAQFARSLGVSTDTVVSWENGRNDLTLDSAETIAAAVGVDPEALLDGKLLNSAGESYSAADAVSMLEQSAKFNARTFNSVQSTAERLLKSLLSASIAAQPGESALRDSHRALVFSFVKWAESSREKFQLRSRTIEDPILQLRMLLGRPFTNSRGNVQKP